jgi:hypothetical protein
MRKEYEMAMINLEKTSFTFTTIFTLFEIFVLKIRLHVTFNYHKLYFWGGSSLRAFVIPHNKDYETHTVSGLHFIKT